MDNTDYITILGWMKRLKVSLVEKMVFSIIYGFSKDRRSDFRGSRQYLADWCECSTKTIDRALASLCASGYIIKREEVVEDVKFCHYQVNFALLDKMSIPRTICPEGCDNLSKTEDKMSHNNIEDNIDDNIAATARVRARAGKKDQDILFRDTLVEAGASTVNVDKLLYIRKQKRLANTERASAQLVESIKIICQRQGVTTDEVVAFMVNPARNWGAIRPDWDGVEKITANVRRSGKTISVADMISRDNRYFQNAAK